jgi:uncharacterized phage protein gp47/JayE
MAEEFKPVFEETETAIRDRMLDRIPADWRKEPGDFIYDAVAPAPPEVKNLQINLDFILKNAYTIFAAGQYLDYKVEEANLGRAPAEKAKGKLQIKAAAGVVIPAGHTAYTVVLDSSQNPISITVDAEVKFTVAGTLEAGVTTEGTGLLMNVPAGSSWIFQPSIPGVETISQAAAFTGGRDLEDDESLRNRWKEKKQKPVRSGNKQNYVSWALEVTGVGAAKVLPLWSGDGTAKVIIIDTNKQPASAALVTEVQNYIDPNKDGQGAGVAPIGAIVTVESAAQKLIDVAADVTLKAGSTLTDAQTEFNTALDGYLSSLTFVEGASVVYTKIGALMSENSHVTDYISLTVNLGTVNIALAANEIPVRGTTGLT